MLKIILTISGIQILAVFAQLIKSKVVAVYLGPSGVGVVTTIDQFVQLVAFVVTLNITESSVKFLSRAYSEGQDLFSRYYAYFFNVLLITSLTGTLLAIGLVLWNRDIFSEEMGKYRYFLIFGLLTLPNYVLGLFFTRVFAATQNYNASSITNFVTTAVSAFGIIVGVVLAGMTGFYIGNIISGTLVTFGIIIYLWKKLELKHWISDLRFWREIKQNTDAVPVTIFFYLTAVVNLLSYLTARYAVLVNFGEAEAGFLHAALALSLVIGLILNPVVKLYFAPIINQGIEKNIKIQHAVKFQKQMIIFFGLASVLIALFPKIILTIMFSSEFIVVSEIIYLFVLSQFIFLIAYINLTILIGLDDIKGYTGTYLSALLLFALLSLILVPYCGISGVAYAHFISSSILFCSTLVRLQLKHNFVTLHNFWLIGYIVAILIFVGQLDRNEAVEWQISGILLKISFFLVFAASLFLFLNEQERKLVFDFKSKFLN